MDRLLYDFVLKRLILFLTIASQILLSSAVQAFDIANVHSFVYQLQDISLDAIGRTGFDLVIVDYSSDGTSNGEFSREQISALQQSAPSGKIVLAYLSIGEAENYRFYRKKEWKPGTPAWIESVNPDWPGNFKVRYWDPAWWAIVKEYLNRILRAGFDGVYLDVIDAYEYFQDRGRTIAAREMIALIDSIRTRAKSFDTDFLVFVQNASELVQTNPDYMKAIDGIGQEDLYFGYEQDGKATPTEITAGWEQNLRLFKDSGKLVLTVDYPFDSSENVPHFDPSTRAKIDQAYSRSRANGFLPYCTLRNLNYLTINPGYEATDVRIETNRSAPPGFELHSNYPNPFNPGTTIRLDVPKPCRIRLVVYDLLGKRVRVLLDGEMPAGRHRLHWDGLDGNGTPLSTGLYICRMDADGFSFSRRMALVR